MINRVYTVVTHALSAVVMAVAAVLSFVGAAHFFGLVEHGSETNTLCWCTALALSALCGLALCRAWEFLSIACDVLCEFPCMHWAARVTPPTINQCTKSKH